MKRIAFLLIAAILLPSLLCGCEKPKTEYYGTLTAVRHAVTEPDEQAAMSEKEYENYEKLVNSMLKREPSIRLSCDENTAAFYQELLRENPYGFLLSDLSYADGSFSLSYAYSEAQQEEIVALMDDTILTLLNKDSEETDTRLDKILKLYYAVTEYLDYDHAATELTELTDSHLRYPGDSVYLALKQKETKCYGFSYLFTFLMLQYDLDCFSVFGTIHSRGDSHMWNLFEYDGEYFYCDPAWDRSEGSYSKLAHFGKTAAEREAETLEAVPFADYHEKGYEAPVCQDERFSIFRGIVRFSANGEHRFYMQDFDENEYIFNTETFSFQ
ncbi:MAG: hypothetical protein IJH32_08855 [Ruminococcus sp.]|nr:hypothetical protein [Ruminococcus sp.]